MPQWHSPVLICKPLPDFDPQDWSDVTQAFTSAASCHLGQGWLEEPHPHFQPAVVRVGWSAEALWVTAELTDLDIYNRATRYNQHTWDLGDVFELFVRPLPQIAWFEFHVTPENQTLQLRWPGPEESYRALYAEQGLSPFTLSDPILTAWTQVRTAQPQWRVLAEVPARSVAESGRIAPGDEWLFSFSRYDYTRGEAEPVLSSSSPHRVCQFDRQEEWRRLRFAL